jgi:hypothetical protein
MGWGCLAHSFLVLLQPLLDLLFIVGTYLSSRSVLDCPHRMSGDPLRTYLLHRHILVSSHKVFSHLKRHVKLSRPRLLLFVAELGAEVRRSHVTSRL